MYCVVAKNNLLLYNRVMITVRQIEQFEKDIKRLKKRYPSVQRHLRYAQRLLEAGTVLQQTKSYPGFGQHEMFKTRVINTDMGNRGKSGGYRLIYEQLGSGTDKMIVLVMLYTKNEFSDENKIMNEIRSRLNSRAYPTLDEITMSLSTSQVDSSNLPR